MQYLRPLKLTSPREGELIEGIYCGPKKIAPPKKYKITERTGPMESLLLLSCGQEVCSPLFFFPSPPISHPFRVKQSCLPSCCSGTVASLDQNAKFPLKSALRADPIKGTFSFVPLFISKIKSNYLPDLRNTSMGTAPAATRSTSWISRFSLGTWLSNGCSFMAFTTRCAVSHCRCSTQARSRT